jgi:threonyl-tRNA synthetase
MNITLPDGSIRELELGSTGLDLASSIGAGLAKAALAVTVNGIQKDLNDPINEDSKVSIITIDSDDGLEIMRHTLTAQVLARAVKNLFPGTKLAIGPTITDGFYYDFEFKKPISPEDLDSIEKEMKKIISSNSVITLKKRLLRYLIKRESHTRNLLLMIPSKKMVFSFTIKMILNL